MKTYNLSRRRFIKSSAVVGGGLIVGFTLPGCSSSEPPPIELVDGGYAPNAFLQITPDNTIYFYSPSDEMGQGVFTGMATLVAEELDVDPLTLIVGHAPGAHADYVNSEMGVQATGGSNAMKAFWAPVRQAGADARALLIAAAAQQLGVDAGALKTSNAHIVVGDKKYPYGDFVATAAAMPMPAGAPLKTHAEFKYIGAQSTRVDALAKSTGTGNFGIDASVPGMQYAIVVRSPVAGAKLLSMDASDALKSDGVSNVIEVSSGIAIVADKYWQARRAASLLKLEWEDVPLGRVNTETVRANLKNAIDNEEGLAATEEGDIGAGFQAAVKTIESEYWAPFLAHAPMEPVNALLRYDNGKAEVWTGTQTVMGAQNLVARTLNIDPNDVKVHNMLLGGGFGRRATLTHIVEVAEIVKQVKHPVKLLWSREDDIRNGIYRPASMMKIRAGVDAEGNITAWHAKRAGGNITPETLRNMMPAVMPGAPIALTNMVADTAAYAMKNWVVDHPSVEGLHEIYSAANKRVEHMTVEHGLPLTFWRSVGHSYNAFASESAADELAEAAGMDPVEFRLKNTSGNPRINNVIRIAGERMKAMEVPEGHHLGFAAHNSFFTDVAQVVEASVEGGQIKVHKVLCVVDCGTAINPDIVRAQMEGGINFALTAALHGELHLENGRIVESNFHDYPILRIDESPAIEVVIVDSDADPTGVGEPGVPPLAPALANAVYRATGTRLRSLPLRLA